MSSEFAFTDATSQKLFGHEAAENEDPKRLREYYFKTAIYDRVAAEVPLRILVGHKGIGKSALFKVGVAEALDAGQLAVVIQPNDISELTVDNDDFLRVVRNWSDGLTRIIVRKALVALGVKQVDRYIPANSGIDAIASLASEAPPDSLRAGAEDSILRFLDDPEITIYIDDLDRGWEARPVDIRRISALLNSVRDLGALHPQLRFKIALRSDVYFSVRTADESTDKVEGSVIWQAWSNHEIFVMLIKRIETFFGRPLDEKAVLSQRTRQLASYLDPIMSPRFKGSGIWSDIPTYRMLMSLIRKRPRDLVKLCTLAAARAHARGSSMIMTQDFDASFEEYSQGRVQDAINEYRSELPNIEALLINMKPNRKERAAKTGYVYRTADLILKIGNIMEANSFIFANGKRATARDLANFMYKINFLTARKEKETEEGIVRKYFEENRYLSSHFADFGFDWEVHPAYRWALQPDDILGLYASLRLSADD